VSTRNCSRNGAPLGPGVLPVSAFFGHRSSVTSALCAIVLQGSGPFVSTVRWMERRGISCVATSQQMVCDESHSSSGRITHSWNTFLGRGVHEIPDTQLGMVMRSKIGLSVANRFALHTTAAMVGIVLLVDLAGRQAVACNKIYSFCLEINCASFLMPSPCKIDQRTDPAEIIAATATI
jgi:hypothetical protein